MRPDQIVDRYLQAVTERSPAALADLRPPRLHVPRVAQRDQPARQRARPRRLARRARARAGAARGARLRRPRAPRRAATPS